VGFSPWGMLFRLSSKSPAFFRNPFSRAASPG